MLEDLWRKNESILRAIVGSVLTNHTLIDDVLQEAYLRMLRTSRRLEDNEQETYRFIRRVVWTTTIDQYRRLTRRTMVPLDVRIASDKPTPLKLVLDQEQRDLTRLLIGELEHALEELTPVQRQAVECYYGTQRKPLKDACSETGIPYSTLRSRMLSGLRRIRTRFEEKGMIDRFLSYEANQGWS